MPQSQPHTAEYRDRTRQSTIVLALVVAVVVLDQATKWWAWRHVPWARINSGGDILVGHTIGAWYASPIVGAILDLLDFGLLCFAVSVLAHGRIPAAVRILGAAMIGGWMSNLLDRLGVHYWTAPGSIRGAVDFIHIGGYYYNVADVFIIGCTPLFLLAAGYQGVRAARRSTPTVGTPPPTRGRVRARVRIPALASAGLILVVAFGAAHYGGVNAATRSPARKPTHVHLDRGRSMPSGIERYCPKGSPCLQCRSGSVKVGRVRLSWDLTVDRPRRRRAAKGSSKPRRHGGCLGSLCRC